MYVVRKKVTGIENFYLRGRFHFELIIAVVSSKKHILQRFFILLIA